MIIVIAILITIICVSVGFIFYSQYQSNPDNTTTDSGLNNIEQNVTNSSSSTPTWHLITKYSGTTSNAYETHDFTSKNGKIKVSFSGLPQKNYGDNELLVYVVRYYNGGEAITKAGESSLNWGSSDPVEEKSDILYIEAKNKKYSVQITPTNIQKWTVTIWDYY